MYKGIPREGGAGGYVFSNFSIYMYILLSHVAYIIPETQTNLGIKWIPENRPKFSQCLFIQIVDSLTRLRLAKLSVDHVYLSRGERATREQRQWTETRIEVKPLLARARSSKATNSEQTAGEPPEAKQASPTRQQASDKKEKTKILCLTKKTKRKEKNYGSKQDFNVD